MKRDIKRVLIEIPFVHARRRWEQLGLRLELSVSEFPCRDCGDMVRPLDPFGTRPVQASVVVECICIPCVRRLVLEDDDGS